MAVTEKEWESAIRHIAASRGSAPIEIQLDEVPTGKLPLAKDVNSRDSENGKKLHE